MPTLEYERKINAPADVVWAVMSDVANYHQYATNLSRIDMLDNDTRARRCYDNKGKGWNESCVLWQAQHVYSYVVDTSVPDYPYPLKSLQGTWRMEPQADGVLVKMQFEVTPQALMGKMMLWVGARSFQKGMVDLMDQWEAEMLKRAALQVV